MAADKMQQQQQQQSRQQTQGRFGARARPASRQDKGKGKGTGRGKGQGKGGKGQDKGKGGGGKGRDSSLSRQALQRDTLDRGRQASAAARVPIGQAPPGYTLVPTQRGTMDTWTCQHCQVVNWSYRVSCRQCQAPVTSPPWRNRSPRRSLSPGRKASPKTGTDTPAPLSPSRRLSSPPRRSSSIGSGRTVRFVTADDDNDDDNNNDGANSKEAGNLEEEDAEDENVIFEREVRASIGVLHRSVDQCKEMDHMKTSVQEWMEHLKDLKSVLRRLKPPPIQKSNSENIVRIGRR